MNSKQSCVLAGDIGGTKTNLGLFTAGEDGPLSVASQTYSSRDAEGLEEMIEKLLKAHPVAVSAACFGIACPVLGGKCRPTNLSWVVSTKRLQARFGWSAVQILNDLTTTAFAVPLMAEKELLALNKARPRKEGNMALVAPGTGLGQAMLLYEEGRYHPIASEGGHADFAPTDEAELDLWRHLNNRFGHVSIERVLSGRGLVNIYQWLSCSRPSEASSVVRQAMSISDPAKVITEYAIKGRDQLCRNALLRFCHILGAVAGNLALNCMATGGVFLGGGILPRILAVLEKSAFLESFTAKGRFSGFLAAIPVNVIRNDKAALLGAAQRALELASMKGVKGPENN